MIEYTILLYPAFDVATAFPLIIINLADNVFSIKYGHFDAEKVGRNTINYYKFGILVPILITSILFFDLGYVSSLSGSLGIIWMGVSIPLFSIATKRMIPASGPNDDYFLTKNGIGRS